MYRLHFSPFPENDQWWGKGFTEWTNATKSVPQFVGHYQPRLPYDLGFYDLRVRETRLRQEELAKKYGIHGFCYYYYWFDGKKIMNGPIEAKLNDKEQDLPFCISWANEAWNANWDGSGNDLLIEQPDAIDARALFEELQPFFMDERYIRIDGKPFFMVYRPGFFSPGSFCGFVKELRQIAAEKNVELFIAVGKTFGKKQSVVTLEECGADAYVEFPPHGFTFASTKPPLMVNKNFNGKFYNLPDMVAYYKELRKNDGQGRDLTFKTVFPMWDNSARRAELGATVFLNATPDVYYDWLSYAIQESRKKSEPSSNLVFVNAWNEWAEGAYLEPDRKYGYAFLQKTPAALYRARPAGEGDLAAKAAAKPVADEPVYFVSAFVDEGLYKKCVPENENLAGNSRCNCVGYDNRADNVFIAKRYNEFLDSYDYTQEAWFFFCHSDWQILENPSSVTARLDRNRIYGPIGAILQKSPQGEFVHEYRGQCYERLRDGSNKRLLRGAVTELNARVDSLDCQCVIVHSSLVEKYSLRFDPRLEFDLYVEDFCISANKNHGIEICIADFACCHWNQAENMDGRESYYKNLEYLNGKHKDVFRAGVVSMIGNPEPFGVTRVKLRKLSPLACDDA